MSPRADPCLPRTRSTPSCGHPSAPTGRPTTARGTAPGNPPQKENHPQALKGRTSLSARSLSTSSPETPFQGSFLLWAANPGRCPGLSSPAPLGLATHRIRPLHPAPSCRDGSTESRPTPQDIHSGGASVPTSLGRQRARCRPFRGLALETGLWQLGTKGSYFFTFSPRSFRASPVDSLAFLRASLAPSWAFFSASLALSWAFLAASLACSPTLAAASFTLS